MIMTPEQRRNCRKSAAFLVAFVIAVIVLSFWFGVKQ